MKRECKFCNSDLSQKHLLALFCNQKCRDRLNFNKEKKKDYAEVRKYYKKIREDYNKCEYCESDFENRTKHLDHIVPYSVAKNNNYENNISVVCHICNCSKGTKDFIDWMSLKGYHIKPYLVQKYTETIQTLT